MQEQKKGYNHLIQTGIVAGVSTVIIIGGGLAAWWAWTAIKGEQPPQWVPDSLQSNQQESPTNPTPTEDKKAQLYWLKVTENDIELAAQPLVVEEATEPSALIEKALTQLLAGVNEAEYTTTIPQETQLRGVSFEADGIHIDLSEDFTFGGGSTSMIGRVGQVLYTATSLNPEAKVWLEIEGQPLEYLGGEGLYIPQPLTREEWQANYQL